MLKPYTPAKFPCGSVHIRTPQRARGRRVARDPRVARSGIGCGDGAPKRGFRDRTRMPPWMPSRQARLRVAIPKTVQNRTQTVRCRTPRLPACKARESRVQGVWRRFGLDRGDGAPGSTFRNGTGVPSRPTPASILIAWSVHRRGRSCGAKQGAIGWRGSETFSRAKTFWVLAPYKILTLGGRGSGCGLTRATLSRVSDKDPRAGTTAVRVIAGHVSERAGSSGRNRQRVMACSVRPAQGSRWWRGGTRQGSSTVACRHN